MGGGGDSPACHRRWAALRLDIFQVHLFNWSKQAAVSRLAVEIVNPLSAETRFCSFPRMLSQVSCWC